MEECEFVFNKICVSETWFPTTELQNNSNLYLTGFNSVPYERSKKSRGGGVLILKKNLSYKIRKDFSGSDEYKEILSLDVLLSSSNILLSCCYKLPKGDNHILSMFLEQIFRKSAAERKSYYLICYWRSQPKLLRIFWKWESFNFLQFTIWMWCNCCNK